MGQVINTNSLSLLTQNNLNKSQSALNSAIERLSSGMRINSAKDDAAGQAIANRFTANIKGLTQAQRNANDGISLAQTTEGSLNEINSNLQRVRELTVQSANGSNSAADKASIQAEITQRMDEINRLSAQTDFNGTKVLSSDKALSFQVGAKDGESITIDLREISSKTLGLSNLNVTNAALDLSKVATAATTELVAAGATTPASTSATVSVALTAVNTSAAATLSVYVDSVDPDVLYVSDDGGLTHAVATYDNATGKLNFDSSTAVLVGTAVATDPGQQISDGAGNTVNVDDVTATDTNPAAAVEIYVDDNGDFFVSRDSGTNIVAATFATDGTVSYNGWGGEALAPLVGLSSALTDYEIPPVVTAEIPGAAAVNANLSGLSSASVGTSPTLHALTKADGSADGFVVKGEKDGADVYYKANVDMTTGVVTLGDALNPDPLAAIDAALSQVDSMRGALGAVQNRFDSVISNLGTTINNLSSSRSRIEDADYATEVSNMSRAQILQQAGTSVLAQANQTTQGVLSLLR
ncbi:flagellin [Rhodoferax sp.]|uniref:flagellin N-terminal helical domain-containing protein n=1 Tax=Rhodoferax sp. TaxID=50421 RepID=UPI00272FE68B|nr:flagellin [Rhodoferax sp.]MDP1530415.1 flagellin [Rhodoferax sp.]MDP1943239.1 flagellin [Rhodoferax sp.]MDP2442717.1 flagellin [Rhodoferax sp.]MDZ4206363.1 flagellin [Rhodoferax sp.]